MNVKGEKKQSIRTETKMLVNPQVLRLKKLFIPPLHFLYFLNFSNKDELFIRKKPVYICWRKRNSDEHMLLVYKNTCLTHQSLMSARSLLYPFQGNLLTEILKHY